jgi:excisionase family DNA binding protein
MSILKMLREKDEPLTVSDIAGLMTVTAATVQRWVRNRQIPFIRVGDVLRFDGEMLADWIEKEGACNQHPRAPEDDCQIRWAELGESTREEVPGPEEKPEDGA